MIRRKSRQRERIYAYVLSSYLHPTAQSIYDALRKEIHSLSLGNVYRNLKILTEEGRIIRRDFGDNIEHFDAITSVHYHFICDKCRQVRDFKMPLQDSLNKSAQNTSSHIIKGHTIEFYGTCEECSKGTIKLHTKKQNY
jgi:Fur family peroxide stress response transcriptional regulator